VKPVPDGSLGSIPGLQENHRRVLAGKLGIVSLRALADADQRAIHTALANLRPRPSLARIAQWQADARTKLTDAEVDRSDWHAAASFAVVFAQRRVGAAWEYRLEAEQTEVEPASESRQWPDWNCEPLCVWMLGHVHPVEDRPHAGAGTGAGQGEAQGEAQDAAPTAAAAANTERAELRIESAAVVNAQREQELIREGALIAVPAEELRAPVRLRLTVGGNRSGQQLRAAVWFRRRAAPGWSPFHPATVSPEGQAEFDLSSVPPGSHNIRLLAWATDPGATLAAVTLPTLTLQQQEEATHA
jgi:hypothetical protein